MRYQRLISILKNLRFIKDSHETHPEENALTHSVQAFVRARKESDDKELWVAALFHDVGKSIESHGHEKLGVMILESFGYHNQKVLWLIENHMRIRGFLSGRVKKHGKIQKLIKSPYIAELIHLRRVDALGREVGKTPIIDEPEINNLLEETNEDS